jgi:hypothetical protein
VSSCRRRPRPPRLRSRRPPTRRPPRSSQPRSHLAPSPRSKRQSSSRLPPEVNGVDGQDGTRTGLRLRTREPACGYRPVRCADRRGEADQASLADNPGRSGAVDSKNNHPKRERIKTDGYDVATLLPLQRDYPWSACRRPRFLASVVWGQWLQQRWIRKSFNPNQVPRLRFTGIAVSGIASRSAATAEA